MSKLKKCPFCGGLSQLGSFLVGCLPCKVSFFFHPEDKEDVKKAVKRWNDRCLEP
jgi:hypothetical protein